MELGQALSGIPWWGYILLIYFVWVGIKATHPKIVPLYRLIPFPFLFFAWSLYSLSEFRYPSLLIWWIAFLSLGLFLGIRSVLSYHLSFDRRNKQIGLPATRVLLVGVIIFFAFKFIWGYFFATQSEVSYWVFAADTATLSAAAGFFSGRALYYVYAYRKR